jgi:hypothetical protein
MMSSARAAPGLRQVRRKEALFRRLSSRHGMARCAVSCPCQIWLRDNMLEGVIRHQFQGPPAGIVLREDWLVMVL